MVSRLATTSAHLTMSAEAQKLEDQIAKLASPNGDGPRAVSRSAFEAIDRRLTELPVSTEEWDTLYRMRLQIERDVLAHKRSRAPRGST